MRSSPPLLGEIAYCTFEASPRFRNMVSMVSPLTVICLVLSLASLPQVLGELACPPATSELEPRTPSDSGHVLVTTSAEEAKNTALCHVVCINLVLPDAGGGGTTATPTSTNSTATPTSSPGPMTATAAPTSANSGNATTSTSTSGPLDNDVRKIFSYCLIG